MAKVIMNEAQIHAAITRMAYEILESCTQEEEICLVGIQRRGVQLAKMLKAAIMAALPTERAQEKQLRLGSLDITFYRDDLSLLHDYPVMNGSDLAFSVDNKTIVLVDDVLYTGRTVRAAMDALFEFGRPKAVRLAILIDRGHRELPFCADFIGKYVPTAKSEDISVKVPEIDGETLVEIV